MDYSTVSRVLSFVQYKKLPFLFNSEFIRENTRLFSGQSCPIIEYYFLFPEQPPPTITVEPHSPDKKPARPELPKMKIGSVKTVTVMGASK